MTERYALRLTKAVEKELFDLQPKQFKQVAKKIFSLQGEPRPQDCKQLEFWLVYDASGHASWIEKSKLSC